MEGCVFEDGVRPFRGSDEAVGWEFRDNIYKGRFSIENRGSIDLPYAYKTVPAGDVPAMLIAAGIVPEEN